MFNKTAVTVTGLLYMASALALPPAPVNEDVMREKRPGEPPWGMVPAEPLGKVEGPSPSP